MSKPNPRNLIGLIILIIGLVLYAGFIGWLAEVIGEMPLAIELVYYVIAGIVWIFPVRHLMKWMTRRP